MRDTVNKIVIAVLAILLIFNIIAVASMSYMNYLNTEEIALIQRSSEMQAEVIKSEINDMKESVVKIVEGQTVVDALQIEVDKILFKRLEEIKSYTEKMKSELKSIDCADVTNVRKANVLMVNYTLRCLGSGTHIRIRNQDYILTAGHLVESKDDIITATGDYGDEYALKLMKLDEVNDLALFRIEGGCSKLGTIEISDVAPDIGAEVTVIGNPAGDVDIITDGTLCKIEPQYYKVTNKAFYGNSGGAMLYKGKLVGVCSQVDLKVNFPVIVIYTRFVKLPIIKTFLRDFTEPIYRIPELP